MIKLKKRGQNFAFQISCDLYFFYYLLCLGVSLQCHKKTLFLLEI